MGAEVGRGASEVKTENSTFSLTLFLPLLPGAFYSQVLGSFCRVLVCIEKIESKQPVFIAFVHTVNARALFRWNNVSQFKRRSELNSAHA